MNKEKPHVLVIEDEENMLFAYKSLLEDTYNVVLANCGKMGLEKINDYTFSAVILDLKLPDMHGLEVLEKIKSIDTSLDVIVSTASDETKNAV